MRWSLVAWLAAALGCGDTAIVVEVRSDGLTVPTELDAFCLAAWDADPAGGEFARVYAFDDDDLVDLPQTLTVEPGEASRAELSVRGLRDGIEVARDSALVAFSGVETTTLSLSRCPAGSAQTPAMVGGVPVVAGTRTAVSFGRGGTLIVAVGPASSALYRATSAGMEDTGLSVPPVSAGEGPRHLLAFDADGDCDDDVLLVPASAPATLWRRETTGSFSALEDAIPATIGAELAAAVADVDGDADIDIVLGGSTELIVLLNDGQGRYTPSATPIGGAASMDVTAVAFGDIDGDGDPDLAVGRGSTVGQLPIALFNAGSGTFVEVPAALPEVPLLARQLEVVDVTGDGFLDVLIGVSASNVRLYANRADGRLEDRSFIALPFNESIVPSAISGGDWDGDCLADVVVGRADGASALLWRGTDGGMLTAETFERMASDQAQLADVDDDGARDLVIVDAIDGLTWTRR